MKHTIFRPIAIFLFSFLLLASVERVYSQTSGGDFGLGIILGEPTGISAKYWVQGNHALDAGLAWSFGPNSRFHLHTDYLIHRFDLIQVDSGRLPFYYGIGGRIDLGQSGKIGVRIPVGLSYYLPNDPFEFFFEIVPILDIAPKTDFSGNGGIGVRYYFGKN